MKHCLKDGTPLFNFCKKDRSMYNKIMNRVKTYGCTIDEAIKMKPSIGRKPNKTNRLIVELSYILHVPVDKVKKAVYNCNKPWYRRIF